MKSGREAPCQEDRHKPAVFVAEVGDAVDKRADQNRRGEREEDSDRGDALDRPDLGQVGGGQHDAEESDPDRQHLVWRQALAGDEDCADDSHGGVSRDDRTHDRDWPDGERAVEGEVREPAEHAEEDEPREVTAGQSGQVTARGEEKDGEKSRGNEVEAECDA